MSFKIYLVQNLTRLAIILATAMMTNSCTSNPPDTPPPKSIVNCQKVSVVIGSNNTFNDSCSSFNHTK